MRRHTRKLTPLLLLACAASGAWANRKAFNIYDDVLASPQYQVLFPDEYTLDSHARELLRSQTQDSPSTFDDERESNANKEAQIYLNDDRRKVQERQEGHALTYEEMILEGHRYLCQIPRVEGEDSNTTSATREANETDEQNDLAKATERGLELLREMEGKCIYFVSGWWSYSFCYKNQVKQFHALPSGSGIPNYPPMEDPTTHSFVLGRFPQADGDDEPEGDAEHKKRPTDIAELQTKGGSRYLVQRLDGGTKCDLTGRNRKIEVQFHCHPQSTDRIGWIKELTTCSYLMVIYTPRLCNDVAFQPPQQEEVHNIECREILTEEDVPEWEAMQEYILSQRLVESAVPEFQVVGGIEVGAKKLVGTEGKQIEKGRVASAGEEKVEVVAKRENGEVQRLSKEELKKFHLDPDKIETLKKQLEELAKGKDWTLEFVEANGERGLRGIVDADEEEGNAEGDDQGDTAINEQGQGAMTKQEKTAKKTQRHAQTMHEREEEREALVDDEEQSTSTDEAEEGSAEEFFKDEL